MKHATHRQKTVIPYVPNLLLGVLVLLVAGGIIAVVVNRNAKQAPDSQSNTSNNQDQPALRVELQSSQQTYRYGDKVSFNATISNDSSRSRTYTFSSTCTQGKLSIDGQPTQATQVCADAITKVAIGAGETKAYSFDFSLVKRFSEATRSLVDGDYIEIEGELQVKAGQHTASLQWQGLTSNDITFTVLE